MFTPTRLAYAIKPHAPIPIMAAAVALAAMFAATPFLIPEIASRYGVSHGSAGLISVVQVAAFAVASFSLPKVLAPSGRLLRVAGAVFLAANILSVFLSVFWLLIAVRLVAGFAAGIVTWIVWVEAMGDRRSLSSISSTGPMTALIGAPILAAVAGSGDQAVYGLLAIVSIPAVLMKIDTSGVVRTVQTVSRSRSNRVLLFSLFLLALAGSSLFVYAAVAALHELGMSATQASFGFSLNAAAGLLGARLAGRHRRPGWFLASTAPAAMLSVLGGHPIWFFVGMAWWGFGFWMGVPGVLQMLSERSLIPAERAGDAQAFMAMGRSLGPAVGGGFADAGAFGSLAVLAGVGLLVSGVTVIGVQEGRERLPPTPSP